MNTTRNGDSFLFEDSQTDNDLLRNKLDHIPSKLYKYRACNHYGFDMLENGYIWADLPESFLDPIDAKVKLRLKRELPDIERWLNLHIGELIYYMLPPKGMLNQKGNQKLGDYIEAQAYFTDENGRLDAKLVKRQMLVEMKRLPKEQKEAYEKLLLYFESEEFERVVIKYATDVMNSIVNVFRSSKIIASLSSRNDNATMWENYADKYTGFCVEYAVPSCEHISETHRKTLLNLFQVKYYKRIPGVNILPFVRHNFHKSLYGKEIDISDSVAQLYRQLIYKRYEYNFEEEWRIVLDEREPRKVDFPFASAVYAGFRISDDNLLKLQEICTGKGIPLYKQTMNSYASRIQYTFIE